jgi:hypothetical protein
MTARRPQSASSLDALLDVATEAMEVSRAQVAREGAEHLQLVAIDAIRPDPLQARRVLPPAVRAGFVTGQLDPPGALAAWRALAEDNADEAELLQDQVVSLATSIREQELVNPITIYPDGRGGYVLETGERRWWAHWWLITVEGEPAFGAIRAQIVAQPSPERQAAENLQDSALTAVQEACQIARLLLHLTGRDPDHVVAISEQAGDGSEAWVGYEPFRSALELERGKVYGKWPVIAQVMGRGERQLLRQLAILKLADQALAVADRGGLTEGQLRPLVSVAPTTPDDRQRRIVTLIARYDLPGAEVTRLVKAADLDEAEARIRRQRGLDRDHDAPVPPTAIRRPSSILVERLRKVHRLAARHEKGGLQIADVVDEIVASDQAGAIYRDLDELTDMLLLLRDELSGRLNRTT